MSLLDRQDSNEEVATNETIAYLKDKNVILNGEQMELMKEMSLSDLCNINIDSDFGDLCKELNLSFGPKTKLKFAIIKLQEKREKANDFSQTVQSSNSLLSCSDSDAEEKEEDPNLQTLVAMGFSKQNAMFALQLNEHDISKAIETLTGDGTSTESKQRSSGVPTSNIWFYWLFVVALIAYPYFYYYSGWG